MSAIHGHLQLEIAFFESEPHALTPASVRTRFAAHVLSRLWAAHLNDTAPLSRSSHATFEGRAYRESHRGRDRNYVMEQPHEFHPCFPDPQTFTELSMSKCSHLWRPFLYFILVFIHDNRRLEQGRVRHARKSLNCIWSGRRGGRSGWDPSLLLPAPATTMMTRKDISFQINEARIAALNKGDESEGGRRTRKNAHDDDDDDDEKRRIHYS